MPAEFQPLAVFMLAHFLAAFLDDTTHLSAPVSLLSESHD
jgi:hypothetical protein